LKGVTIGDESIEAGGRLARSFFFESDRGGGVR
jgi:hypothetical protein